MKGKAGHHPSNHVEWANGFKSNMPDWPTTRRVAVSDRLLFWARECRSLLLAIERPEAFVGSYDRERFISILNGLQEVIGYAELGIDLSDLVKAPRGVLPPSGPAIEVKGEMAEIQMPPPMPLPTGFPKPPGFL